MIKYLLRPWDEEDLESLVKYANNPKIAENMTDGFPHPYTTKAGKNFIELTKQSNPRLIFAIEINGEACGGIGIHPQNDIYRKNAELGYWLGEPFWGQGVVSRAVLEMVDYGFKTLDIDRIFARPYGRNIASQRILEKTGFKLEARFENTIWKNNKYEDELIYAIRRRN